MPAELFNWNVIAVGFILCIASIVLGYQIGYGMGKDEAVRQYPQLMEELTQIRNKLKQFEDEIDTRI